MSLARVLVAYSSRSGSTAGAAGEIAGVLGAAGLEVDCRPKEEVIDVTPYGAVIVGSGVFVASHASDGGGFVERHRTALRDRDVWLFSIGPIGGHAGRDGPDDEPAVFTVARLIGARGVAMFGAGGMSDGPDPVDGLVPTDRRDIRTWAGGIAADLGAGPKAQTDPRQRCHGMIAAH